MTQFAVVHMHYRTMNGQSYGINSICNNDQLGPGCDILHFLSDLRYRSWLLVLITRYMFQMDIHNNCRLQKPLSLTSINFNYNMDNHMPSKVWGKITYPLPNFKRGAAHVLEWMNNFTPHSKMDVITYSCLNLSKSMLVNGALIPSSIAKRFTERHCLGKYALKYLTWTSYGFPPMLKKLQFVATMPR